MTMTPRAAVDWNIMLRDGFFLPVSGPTPLDLLITVDLGLEPEYMERRVATVFLNGKPVDEMHEAIAANGSVIGLSGFMPGIAGITMRRNSPVAALRRQITSESTGDLPQEPGHVLVKLFNNVTDEAGPDALARGVLFSRKTLAEFLQTRDELFWQGLLSAEADSEPASRDTLQGLSPDGVPERTRVMVRTAQP
jgi:hypothetical protein